MTIKEFASLCACHTQTLRYYDKIDLLKPIQVDPWSGYRYYAPEQAITFVKIKNLQAADFTIGEIKELLTLPDAQVYQAFDIKIAQQTQKLERIREIQRTYLTEKNTMEQIIHSMTDYLLSQCRDPEVLREFGMEPTDAPAILARVKAYLNTVFRPEAPAREVTMTVNDEIIRGEEAVLARIQSLSGENLADAILLDDGRGQSMDYNANPEPDFPDYDVLWERKGWDHVYEFLSDLPRLEPGREYCLWIHKSGEDTQGLSFPIFLLGAVLCRQPLDGIIVNCASSVSEEKENHFKLLAKR